MVLFYIFLYIVIGAAISSAYYYVRLRGNKVSYRSDVIPIAVTVGIFWPVAAVFAFGLHYAEEFSGR